LIVVYEDKALKNTRKQSDDIYSGGYFSVCA